MAQTNLHAVTGDNSSVNSVPCYSYTIVNEWPHDPSAYTEGLLFYDHNIYESTGGYGESSIRKMAIGSRTMLKKKLADEHYGEGLTIFDGKLFQLTWTSEKGFIYEPKELKELGSFEYKGKGWGLTNDKEFLIVSDGSDQLSFLDPVSFEIKKSCSVKDDQGLPLDNLNELEYIHGEIYANIHYTNRIARIDPPSCRLLGWIDLTGLGPKDGERPNGIAYDEAGDRLFVTGKNWPSLFEIRIVP